VCGDSYKYLPDKLGWWMTRAHSSDVTDGKLHIMSKSYIQHSDGMSLAMTMMTNDGTIWRREQPMTLWCQTVFSALDYGQLNRPLTICGGDLVFIRAG
jgi:hypothetical protein